VRDLVDGAHAKNPNNAALQRLWAELAALPATEFAALPDGGRWRMLDERLPLTDAIDRLYELRRRHPGAYYRAEAEGPADRNPVRRDNGPPLCPVCLDPMVPDAAGWGCDCRADKWTPAEDIKHEPRTDDRHRSALHLNQISS
jgi:hypothetical protein